MLDYLPFIIGGVIALLVIVLLVSGYVKAPPDMAYLISGHHKKPRILIGKAGIKIPFFERLDKLSLGAVQVDVKTSSSVPTAEYINIKVDSTVSVRVGRTPEMIELAAQNFLNVDRKEIAKKITDLLEGNVREIVGSMKLTEMVNDRKAFSEAVQKNAVPDLKSYGLELVTFNVQNFIDDNDVILNLGIDNVEQIRKSAAIAKSNAQREIAIAEAENAKTANDAKVKAAEEIAVRNNALAIKQAGLQKAADTEKARAEAAKGIEAENQRKLKDVAETEANIAKAEKQAELKQREIELKEYELTALVRKQADAEKYKAEKDAEAKLAAAQRDAEAEKYEREKKAEADLIVAQKNAEARKAEADANRYAAEAEAAAIETKGKAEAEAIRLKGEAEAIGIEKKAEAQAKMKDASIVEMLMKALPEMTAAAAAPLANVDKIIQYGDGNSTKLIKDVTGITSQVFESLNNCGIDLKSILAGMLGGKVVSAKIEE